MRDVTRSRSIDHWRRVKSDLIIRRKQFDAAIFNLNLQIAYEVEEKERQYERQDRQKPFEIWDKKEGGG